jgi:restriction endonuclease S subunit
MKATDAYKTINNSPIKGIILYYTKEILKELPVKKLGSVIHIIQTGKTPPKANHKYYQSEDVNWFKPSDIGYSKYLIDAKEKFSKIAVDEKKATIYPKETLLMIGIGGGVGRVSIIKEEGSSNQQITGITFNDEVLTEYAYYYYLVREDYVKSQAKSMSFPILNQAKIKELVFAHPSKEEQKEFTNFISACWEAFLKYEIPNFEDFKINNELKKYALQQFKAIKLDSQIKKNIKTQKQLLSHLRQAILQEAIQGKLTSEWRTNHPELISGANSAENFLKQIKAEKAQLIKDGKIKKEKPLPTIAKEEIPFELPVGWVWSRLGEITHTITKGSSPKWQGVQYVDEGVLFVTSENVGTDKILLNKKKYVQEIFNEIEPRSILQKGDILTNIVGASIGRTAIWNLETIANINQAVCLIRFPKEYLNKQFLVNILNSDFGIKLMMENQFDTGRGNLSLGAVSNFKIPIPSLEEQKAIIEKVAQLMQKCQALDYEIKQSETNAQMLMQAVLKEAFEVKEEVIIN